MVKRYYECDSCGNQIGLDEYNHNGYIRYKSNGCNPSVYIVSVEYQIYDGQYRKIYQLCPDCYNDIVRFAQTHGVTYENVRQTEPTSDPKINVLNRYKEEK